MMPCGGGSPASMWASTLCMTMNRIVGLLPRRRTELAAIDRPPPKNAGSGLSGESGGARSGTGRLERYHALTDALLGGAGGIVVGNGVPLRDEVRCAPAGDGGDGNREVVRPQPMPQILDDGRRLEHQVELG